MIDQKVLVFKGEHLNMCREVTSKQIKMRMEIASMDKRSMAHPEFKLHVLLLCKTNLNKK